MTASNLLSELAELGARLTLVDGDRLSVVAPKGTLPDELRARIAAHKPELVDWLLDRRRSAVDATALPVIVPDHERVAEPFPLTDLQASFLVGMREEMEYFVKPHFYCETDHIGLDPVRFETAVNLALRRQRDNIVTVTDDFRLRRVDEPGETRIPVVDLRGLPNADVEKALAEIRATMSEQSLPVDRWPWFDWRISLRDENTARVHANLSNFFSDGFGTTRFMASVRHCYDHPDVPLPELSPSFRDCALALVELDRSPLGRRSEQYWTERLPLLPDAPPLPLAPVDPNRRSRLRRRELLVPARRWRSFREHAAACGVTPSNALYAVYAEVIAYWSGSRHFLLNAMMSHRFPLHPDIGEVVGNFASLYPLEVDWRADAPFRDRANRLQDQVMSDLLNSYCSSVRVLEALNRAKGTPGRAVCPFVVASGLFMGTQERYEFSRLETPQAVLDHQFFELADGELWIVWDVLEDAFPEGLVDDLCGAYDRLLERLSDDRSAWSAHSFDLLPAEQRAQRDLLNRCASTVPDGLLHDGLARQAIAAPEKPAVIAGSEVLTYSALHGASGRLAHLLTALGARPGEPVGVLLPKGPQNVVALHGILAAGAAYVPLDPAWPLERTRLLVADTRARFVVTTRSGADLPGARTIAVDDGADLEPLPGRAGGDLAYVIYTSGSTGTPKGVALGHRGPVNTIADVNARFDITADDVLFGVSSPCFDLSVYDVFGSSAVGMTLVLPDQDATPTDWVATMLEHRVTVWNSAPALMRLLVDAAADVRLPALRIVLLSGDWIPVDLPDRIREVAPNAEVISLGGATEASIWSIHHRIGELDSSWHSIPYGTPLANQTWHVLAEDGHDMPTWAPGHLHIGGVGLADGYWGDEARTNTAFVPHPATGERIYRTGDLGRYRPDGTIEFLGRSDGQVKIQGFRVEPGEVEHALLAHDRVRSTAVVAREDEAGKRLVAFVVPDGAVDVEEIRGFLAARLPSYLLPDHVLLVDDLPVTSNGKLDRGALAAAGPEDTRPDVPHVAPRTPLESALADIWESVLGVSGIGVHQDFFASGGTSFTALMVITRITARLGHRVPLGALLASRTVAALAVDLQRDTWSPLVALNDDRTGTPCFLVHPAGGDVLCYRALAERLDRPCYGLQAPETPVGDIGVLAERYVHAIRSVGADGAPWVLGGWSSGGAIAFEMARLLERDHEEVDRVLMIDAPAPLDHRPVDEVSLVLWFAEDLGQYVDADARAELAAARSTQERLTVALRSGRLDVDSLLPVYRVFRAVVLGVRAYHPEPIEADIRVLRAEVDAVSEFADHPAIGSPDWGWSGLTAGRVTWTTAPGSHHAVLTEHVDAVRDALDGGAR